MLGVGRRPRGRRITARTLVYCGWVVSTLTILVIFITALDGYQDYTTLPWDTVSKDSSRSEIITEDNGVEKPNRRSLSAEDSESNSALEVLAKGIRGTDEQLERLVRKRQRLEGLLFQGAFLRNNNGSSFFSMHGSSRSEDDLSPINVQRNGGKIKAWTQLPAWKQVNAKEMTLEIQTQIARPESGYIHRYRNAKVNAMDLSHMDKESRIPGRDLTPEELPSAMGINDGSVVRGGRGGGRGGGGRGGGRGGRGHQLPVTQIQMPNIGTDSAEVKVSARSADGVALVEDGIFWSRDVEQLIPEGITDDNVSEFRAALSRTRVQSMQDPQWNRCGRPKNQFVVLEDGTHLCARYRSPQDTLIRGEILSFHLSRLLAIDNVPAVILSQLNASDTLWRTQNFTAAQWSSGNFVALIQWMNDLNHEKSRVRIPRVLLSSYESRVAMTAAILDHDQLTTDQLTSLAQWTDLILFDYITGHYDRVASMQDGAEREMKPSIMSESIRNLRQIRGTGKLILIDNESGLIDGYELMYHGAQSGLQFLGFHRRLLRSTCVFRRRTVARIRWLAAKDHPERVLEEYANLREPLYRKLKETPEVGLFRTYFRVRLKEVVDWIDYCDSLRSR